MFKFAKPALFLYFAALAAFFAFVVPPFEAPDEPGHLAYINYFASRHALTDQNVKALAVFGEGNQPPLYYAAASLVSRLARHDGIVKFVLRDNKKHSQAGGGDSFVPRYYHPGEQTFAAPSGRAAFYLLRLFSVWLALLNLYFIYKIAGLFFNDETFRFLAAALAAALPQFVYLSGMINNDNLSNLLAAICLFYVFKLFNGPTERKNYLWLGLCLGLGLLAKASLLVLLPGLAAAFIYAGWKNGRARFVIVKYSLLCLAVAALLSGWWFIRNLLLYGDLLGRQAEMRALAHIVAHRPLFTLLFGTQFCFALFLSFVGAFGWLGVLLPDAAYCFYGLLMVAAAAGVYLGLKRAAFAGPKIYLALFFIALNLCGVIGYNLTFVSMQGRLMFPTLSLIVIMLAYGLRGWLNGWSDVAVKWALFALVLVLIIIDLASVCSTVGFYYNPISYL
jgi:4-amino-4-deoxy-L-arabinose transferase-like glycosyltransferase